MVSNYVQEELSDTQKVQEVSYFLPYHYASLMSQSERIDNYSQFSRYKNVINTAKKHKGDSFSILDIGCGDGRFCYELKDEIKEGKVDYCGIDYSTQAISFAKVFNPYATFVNEDFYKFSREEEKRFDVIVMVEVLEHIEPSKIQDFLKCVKNLLKDDGVFIVTVPSKNLRLAAKHYQHFTKATLENTLENHFKVLTIEGYYHKSKLYQFIMNLITYVPRFFFLSKRRGRFFQLATSASLSFFNKKMLKVDPEIGLGLVSVSNKKI